jgi:hypothetical protein
MGSCDFLRRGSKTEKLVSLLVGTNEGEQERTYVAVSTGSSGSIGIQIVALDLTLLRHCALQHKRLVLLADIGHDF